MGCLLGLIRGAAGAFFRLGAWFAAALMRGLAFLFLGVIGPLFLGATREVVRTILGARSQEEGTNPRGLVGGRLGYALVSGLIWVSAYFALRGLWALLGWLGAHFLGQLSPDLPAWLPLAVVSGLLFVGGSVVGWLAHRFENQTAGRW